MKMKLSNRQKIADVCMESLSIEKNMNSITGERHCVQNMTYFLSVRYSNSRCIPIYLLEISERQNTVRPNYSGIVFSMK